MTPRLLANALDKLVRTQAWLALPVLCVPVLLYVVTWYTEPYLFAFTVVGLAPLQLCVALIGLCVALSGRARSRKRINILYAVALTISAVAAFLVMQSINWG